MPLNLRDPATNRTLVTACHKSVQPQQFVEAEERGTKESFHGVMEVWCDNAKTLIQAMEMPEMQQLMQEQDIDFPTSRKFFTEWN